MVFSGLAAHVKDIQRTGTLHAAPRVVDMQKDKPACQSTGSGKHGKDTPPRPLSPWRSPWSHPSWTVGLYLARTGLAAQFLTRMPQVYPYLKPKREKTVSLHASQPSICLKYCVNSTCHLYVHTVKTGSWRSGDALPGQPSGCASVCRARQVSFKKGAWSFLQNHHSP